MFKGLKKSWFPDRMIYHEFMGVNDFGEAQFETCEIEGVRIDRQKIYATDSNQRKMTGQATVFCFATHTTPFLEFKLQSEVEVDHQRYTIITITPLYEYDQLIGYELEMI